MPIQIQTTPMENQDLKVVSVAYLLLMKIMLLVEILILIESTGLEDQGNLLVEASEPFKIKVSQYLKLYSSYEIYVKI